MRCRAAISLDELEAHTDKYTYRRDLSEKRIKNEPRPEPISADQVALLLATPANIEEARGWVHQIIRTLTWDGTTLDIDWLT